MSPTRPDPIAYLTGRLTGAPRPPAITPEGGGGKFTPEGRVLPFPGNTVICHVPQDTPAWAALLEMQDALRAGAMADRFAFLPPASFHMTIFAGVSGPRGDGRPWPEGVPATAPLETVTETMGARLAEAPLPQTFRARPVGLFAGHSVTMQGADKDAEAELRAARRAMREATGFRMSDFESYVFHITLAYLLDWLDEAEAQELVALSDALFAPLAQAMPEITLGPAEYCTFDTMHHFEPIALLGRAGVPAHD